MKSMERESSDEEDDHENLIQSYNNATTFHIDHHLKPPSFCLHLITKNKRYILAILVPLFFIILFYFSTDIIRSPLFATHVKLDPLASRMRESELQAISLLNQQKLGLFALWNRTFNSTSNLDEIKSALAQQFHFNNQIRQVLLSPHRSGNDSTLSDVFWPDISFDRCGKLDRNMTDRRSIEWKPGSRKYLFAICLSGQMSNHLICLEKHMFFAALLNRVLVIPSSKFDFQYNHVLDIDHVNQCLGRKVVVSFEEFSEIQKGHMHIDRLMCYFSLPQPCYVDNEHIKKLKAIGVSIGKIESAWVEDIKKPNKRTAEDVKGKFSMNDDVIAIGDVFYAEVEQQWAMQPGGPIAHKCKTLIEPSRLIMLTAQRFVQTFLGNNFIALHFRRHGFLKFCNAKKPSCFFPVPQAAECISQVVQRANTPVIYLSTDAAESETSLLQSLVVVNGKAIPFVQRPARNAAEKWDALLYRHELDGDPQVEAMLDKTVSAMARVFIGSSGSTFTEDILRLRKDWGSASLCDQYLCQAQLPNFIAGDE